MRIANTMPKNADFYTADSTTFAKDVEVRGNGVFFIQPSKILHSSEGKKQIEAAKTIERVLSAKIHKK